jgi:hypothetical protein
MQINKQVNRQCDYAETDGSDNVNMMKVQQTKNNVFTDIYKTLFHTRLTAV